MPHKAELFIFFSTKKFGNILSVKISQNTYMGQPWQRKQQRSSWVYFVILWSIFLSYRKSILSELVLWNFSRSFGVSFLQFLCRSNESCDLSINFGDREWLLRRPSSAPADPPLSPRKAILNPLLILKLCCSQSFLPLPPSLSLGHGGSHFDYEKAVPSVR